MTNAQRKEIRVKTVNDLDALTKEIKELQELCQPITPECSLGDLARFELMNDQLISEKSLHQAKIRQKKLKYALRKVEEDTYGLCMECEEEIPFRRLLLLPEATHCIGCASAV